MTTSSIGMLDQLDQHTKASATTADFIIDQKQLRVSSFQRYLAYQQKFEMASRFVGRIRNVLAVTDRHNYGPLYLWYHAVRYIMKNAFTGDVTPCIIYDKVLISRGYLWNTHSAMAVAGSGEITFVWSDDSGIGAAKPTDKCILVVYCEALNKCVFSSELAERSFTEATLAVSDFRGHTVHTWLGFMSATTKKASNSVYTGELMIT